MMNSGWYSNDEKLEILDRAAKFMTENIDSIKDAKEAYREISRFFVSCIKRPYEIDLDDFNIVVRFVKSYINEKNITIDGIGESGEISYFRHFKLDKERKTLEKSDPLCIVEHICSRFHLIAQQLRNRHNNRTTLTIADEYDVQDLLHALLKIHFDDVRPEEYTPSYAGGSSRMDFLLKEEKMVVEVKKTRGELGSKELGNQLLIDINRYKEHPDLKTLFCFVYDPDGRISNPRGLENDLAKEPGKIMIKVLIAPKGY